MPLVHTVPAVFAQFLRLARSAPLYHAQEIRETDFPYRRATGHVLRVGKLGVVLGRWSGQYSDDLLEAVGGEDLGEWRPAGGSAGDPAQPEAADGEGPAAGAAARLHGACPDDDEWDDYDVFRGRW